MRLKQVVLVLAASLALAAPAGAATYRDQSVPMNTVAINVNSYLGTWYEIARFPNRFERNCAGVTAQYSMNPDDTVKVLNTCRKGSPSGTASTREATATVVGEGKFSVDFVKFLPGVGKGKYWVLYVDPGYNLAVVGEPTGRYGWILSRTPQIRQSDLDMAKSVLTKNGYDTTALELVAQ